MNEISNPYGFVYITTNMINGMRYIGQKSFNRNWKCYLGSGKRLKFAIKKYGKENFKLTIVAFAFNRDELNNLEKQWIDFSNAVFSDNYYNIAEGGYNNPFLGKTKKEIEEFMKPVWENNKNKTLSSETKEKMRISHKQNLAYNSKKVICLNTKEIFNSIMAIEEKYNISNTNIVKCCKNIRNYTGKLLDGTKLVWAYYEDYMNMSISEIEEKIKAKDKNGKGRHSKFEKKIICLTTGEIFNRVIEASEKYNIRSSGIVSCCNGTYKTSGNMKWMYYEDYIAQQNNKVS